MPVKQIGSPPTKLTFLKEIEMFAKSFTENLISPIVSNEGKNGFALMEWMFAARFMGRQDI